MLESSFDIVWENKGFIEFILKIREVGEKVLLLIFFLFFFFFLFEIKLNLIKSDLCLSDKYFRELHCFTCKKNNNKTLMLHNLQSI